MKQILILSSILVLLLGFAYLTKAQDTIRTPTGYEIDFEYLHVKVDTIHNHTTIAHYYHRRAYVSINGGKAILMNRGDYMTAWSIHPLIVVTRKKFKQSYQL